LTERRGAAGVDVVKRSEDQRVVEQSIRDILKQYKKGEVPDEDLLELDKSVMRSLDWRD
jgi:O-phosphoseryl-tRNA(Cys) synthetase